MSLAGFGLASNKTISEKWENAVRNFALLQNFRDKGERVGIRFGAPISIIISRHFEQRDITGFLYETLPVAAQYPIDELLGQALRLFDGVEV